MLLGFARTWQYRLYLSCLEALNITVAGLLMYWSATVVLYVTERLRALFGWVGALLSGVSASPNWLINVTPGPPTWSILKS